MTFKAVADNMSPRRMVNELDRYIIGQEKAKKAVAIALRNRVRRQLLDKELQEEISPKNIIMIGPTGVGKTEIARRLSKITGAPFLKVEATKYTEVGYVGRDVESMIRDLLSVAIGMVKQEMYEKVKEEAIQRSEDALLDLLLPQQPLQPDDEQVVMEKDTSSREFLRKQLRDGELEDRNIELQVQKNFTPSVEIFSSGRTEEMDLNWDGLQQLFGGGKQQKKMSIRQAREHIIQDETEKLVDSEQLAEIAKDRVENMGIIFIDEIDKVIAKGRSGGVDVSREGVQRDILPIIEGSQVSTKHGVVDTAHILFIAAGAFHANKPSDLIPELQGRFPVRVELQELKEEDFFRILQQPENALIHQYKELLAVEGVKLEFALEAIQELAKIAAEVNQKHENIGARRLHTVMELLLEELSFSADELSGQVISITPQYVQEKLQDVVQNDDLSRYIL